MLLWKPAHVDPICEGLKTATRRCWKRARVKVGGEHRCFTRPPWTLGGAEPFALIEIRSVRPEALAAITLAGVRAEGSRTIAQFREVWIAIHGRWEPDREIWAVTFHLTADLRAVWRATA